MNNKIKCSLFLILAVASSMAFAEVLDRPTGIKIGQRMTLRPYVSFSATYDSNVGGQHANKSDDVMWTVSPTLALDYRADTWALMLNLFYNYHAYSRSRTSQHNQHSYGETLRWSWANTRGAEKGWTLMLSESFQQISMADDMMLSDGTGYTADRRQVTINGAVQRRFNENFHSDLSAGYYFLEYDNDTSKNTQALYGWQRWNAGLDAGYAPSPWTDFLVSVGYSGYNQDNAGTDRYGKSLSRNSQGYTAQAGIGSFATERISYRALAGWSRFEYADGASSDDGFVYTVSGSWKIGETWNMMLLASSYYQPSERELSSKSRVDAVSWGLAKSLIRGKLRATLDATYRHQTNDSLKDSSYDYELDIATARLGFHYTLNRFFGFFAYGEYQRSWNDESEKRSGYADYDRWRATVGFRLTY